MSISRGFTMLFYFIEYKIQKFRSKMHIIIMQYIHIYFVKIIKISNNIIYNKLANLYFNLHKFLKRKNI